MQLLQTVTTKRHINKASKAQKTQAIKEEGGQKKGHQGPGDQRRLGLGVPSPSSEGSEPGCGSPGARASQCSAEPPADRPVGASPLP